MLKANFKQVKQVSFIISLMISTILSAQWTQDGVSIVGDGANNYCGSDVYLSGDGFRLAVGASGDNTSGTGFGEVKIYEKSGADWAQIGQTLYGDSSLSEFGSTVCFNADGSVVAVGAPGYNSDRGYVKVYEFDGTQWLQKGSTLWGSVSGEFFGTAISLNSMGDILSIGAPLADANGIASGRVEIYLFGAGTWQINNTINGNAGDHFGASVSLSDDGQILAVGAPSSLQNSMTGAGKVTVYDNYTSTWISRGSILTGTNVDANFGCSIDLSSDGNSIVIGADGVNTAGSNTGAAYVYDFNATDWQLKGNYLPGDFAGDFFGYSVDISSDGNTIAVGAIGYDVPFSDAGRVGVYEFLNGTDWSPKGNFINGMAAYNYFGTSVALNDDGMLMAAGARGSSSNGTSSGMVNVYRWGSGESSCILASYPFYGDAMDETNNGYDGFINSVAQTDDRFDNPGSAFVFNGSSSYIELPDTVLSQMAFGTITAWVQTDNPINYANFPIISKAITQATPIARLEIENGYIKFTIDQTYQTTITSDFQITDNLWHQVGVSWSPDSIKIIYDGVYVKSIANVNNSIINLDEITPVYIGKDMSTFYANGIIDDVKIYSCDINEWDLDYDYHDNYWGYEPFVTDCYNFNDNLVPFGFEAPNGDSTAIVNGKFMTVYNGYDGFAEMKRFGNMPENSDSLIIEWDAMVSSAEPFHFTGIGIFLPDTKIFFIHNQSLNYDYGAGAVGGDNGLPQFLENDSMAISTGIYRNKLVCTNSDFYFTSKKISNPNIIPFAIHINPFQLDTAYSLQNIHEFDLIQQDSSTVGYNWMDNLCVKVILKSAEQFCDIARYNFDANLADISGNGFNMHINNGPFVYQSDRFGNSFKSVYLNSSNQALTTLSAPAVTGDFTLSTWVYPDPFSGTDTAMIFSNYPNDGTGGNDMMLGIFEQTGQIFFGHMNTDGSLFIDLTDFAIPTSVWSHLVLKRDSANLLYTLFFNEDSVRSFNYPVQPSVSGSSFEFAISETEPNFSFKGRVDDVKLYRCLLDEAQIDNIYHADGWPQVMCDGMTIDVTTNDASCGMHNGSASVVVEGGSGSYNINWSNGDEGYNTTNGFPAGMHSVQVTDSIYGCMLNQYFSINNTGAPTLNFNKNDLTCWNDGTGSATVTIIGGVSPYAIAWSNGATANTISNLPAGNYQVTVTDMVGCMITSAVNITQPSRIQSTFDVTSSSCGNADGSITANPTGGMGNYQYSWSNSQTSQTISNLVASNYSVTIKDQSNCQRPFTVGFSDSGSPMVIVDSTHAASCGGLGGVFVSVEGGSGSYTYEWSNGLTYQDLDGFEPGEYWLTVTDGTCSTMLNTEIPFDFPQNQDICVVTVDPNTAKNLVVWEKVQASGIDHYNIYREGFVADEYQLVGTVNYDDMSEYSDSVASPFNRSWKYKISAADACGNESNLSPAHKTIHISINLGLGGSINLMWDDYSGFAYTSFYINRHTTAGGWEVLDQMPIYLHSYSDTPTDLYGLWYSITVDAPGQCVPTSSAKASGGPYYQSVSNVEDEGAIDTKTTTLDPAFNISLFPNPNNGRFIIGISELVSGQVEIIDVSGKVVALEKFINKDRWINDRTLDKGIYLIKLSINNNGVQIMKMIVE